jgi:hypothetical protein
MLHLKAAKALLWLISAAMVVGWLPSQQYGLAAEK